MLRRVVSHLACCYNRWNRLRSVAMGGQGKDMGWGHLNLTVPIQKLSRLTWEVSLTGICTICTRSVVVTLLDWNGEVDLEVDISWLFRLSVAITWTVSVVSLRDVSLSIVDVPALCLERDVNRMSDLNRLPSRPSVEIPTVNFPIHLPICKS